MPSYLYKSPLGDFVPRGPIRLQQQFHHQRPFTNVPGRVQRLLQFLQSLSL